MYDQHLTSPGLKGGKISRIHNIFNDENCPDNQQKMSVIKPLEATVQINSCSNGNKLPKKRRLNLKTKTAAKVTTSKQKQHEVDEDHCLEESKKLHPVLNCDDLEGLGENKGSKSDSIRCCPVCKYDFTSLDSDFKNLSCDAEINEHINKCLDGEKAENVFNLIGHNCQLCGKDLTKYSTVRHQQHINRCSGNIGKTRPNVELEMTSIVCPICGKAFKTTKSRQTHMKKCAKENNVSTHQLVKLSRQENVRNSKETAVMNTSEDPAPRQSRAAFNCDTLGLVRNKKRKRLVNLPSKKLDEDIQLALALSVSMQCDNADVKDLEKKKKKKKENSELPALLLRSDDEMKKVTEARAAAVLCQWVDNDDEIQCTPALAPSLLVKKYGKESSCENFEILPEQAAEYDDVKERCNSPTIKVRGGSGERNEKCGCEESVITHGEESKQHFTVDTKSRLWCLSSLRPDIVANNGFYVPNLLPKSTPTKKKAKSGTSSTKDEEQIDKSAAAAHEDKEDVEDEPPSRVSSQTDGLTESQEKDIDMLVELLTDETPDTQSTRSEMEQNNELDKTWLPSSGFCVRKNSHEMEDKNKEDVDALLNDLSCMVGNPLLSDVEIVAKDEKKFFAHSFMLTARCSSLAEILHASESRVKDDERNTLIRVELLDIDVRAVRAVLTYIYTAYFIPVVDANVLEDVKKLVDRWNLNCSADKWKVIRDGKKQNQDENIEHADNNVGDLDVLLKSLWEGEEVIISDKNVDENAFGDSILDDQLRDMEIKIYTQAVPQTISHERNDTCAVVLDSDSEDCISNMNDNVELISENFDEISCIPESPSSSPGQHGEKRSVENVHDLTIAEQPLDDILKTKTKQSSRPNDTSIETIPQLHSFPIAQEFNGDVFDYLDSCPVSLHSPSSSVELMSSPERSPLPDNLKDFDVEDKSSNSNTAQKYSMQISIDSPLLHSPYASPNKSLKRNHCEKDEDNSFLDIFESFPGPTTERSPLSISKHKINDDSCFDINLSILSPKRVVCNEKNRHGEGNKNQQVNQPLGFSSKDQDINSKEKVSFQENRCSRMAVGDFKKSTTKQACAEKKVDVWLDDSSLEDPVMKKHETGLKEDEIITEKEDRRSTTSNDVFKTPKRQFCGGTRYDDSLLTIEGSNSKDTRNTQEGDHFKNSMRVVETPIKQSAVDVDDSPLQLENKTTSDDQNNFYESNNDEFIYYYDHGGFNCDIEDYFHYDTHSSTEKDDSNPLDERPAAVEDVNEKTLNIEKCEKKVRKINNVQTEENKKDDRNRDVKKGKSGLVKGKTDKAENEIVSKRTQELFNQHQEEPKTPMHDYSNMATPELKVELKQYGVRPLAKRKMVIKLKEIYHYTHKDTRVESEGDEDNDENQPSCSKHEQKSCEVEEVESRFSADTKFQDGNTRDMESSSDSEQNCGEEEQSSDDSEVLSQRTSSNLSKTLMSFLTHDHELYLKILKYMPLSVSDVLETVKENGIKCSAEQLKNFFDEQCITYSEPRPSRVQKRKRRGKVKSSIP
ncbi:uncharacterized protein LOC114524527 isoform X2 [Dendronephthya gigantea]|uniref:uncharacterized protein LOC114524527 isoform X2 n=1 Tax=Dendronephthya gigantea TaxID=151771 RepID=UPI00106C585B|nr:uncharacterized protein LOC114524527 isoform X2 [Dendronephthya gigantea]